MTNWAERLRKERKSAMIDLLRFCKVKAIEEGEDGYWLYRIDEIKGHWIEKLFIQDKKYKDIKEIHISLTRRVVEVSISYPTAMQARFPIGAPEDTPSHITEWLRGMTTIDMESFTYEDIANYIEKLDVKKDEIIFDEPFHFLK